MSTNIALLTVVILLLPMFYLLLAAPAFLFVRLDIPQVARLLRAMLYGYFQVLVAVGLLSMLLNALSGGLHQSAVFGVVTLLALILRRWILRRFDTLLAERQAGTRGTALGMRHLHWLAMSANALQIAAIIRLIPSLIGTT